MLSPSTYSLSRQAPPIQPSQSLEGMEKVIPPGLPVPYAHTVSRLHLDKPLPDLPENPPTPFIGSTAWSDDSSTVNSFDDDHSVSRPRSAESYPVFVRSGSADLPDFVDPSVPVPVSPLDRTPSPSADPYHHEIHQKPVPTLTFLTTEDTPPEYIEPTPQPHWNPAPQAGPNHYFREKKWDFFPELAPSGLPQTNNSPRTYTNAPRSRKKDSGRSRWIALPSETGAAIANDVRNSFRYIQRRLSRNSLEKAKSKENQRPATAPNTVVYPRSPYPVDPSPRSQTAPLPDADRDSFTPHSHTSAESDPLYVSLSETQVVSNTDISLASTPTGSTISDQSLIALERESHLETPMPPNKQPAVPISSYQRYGAAIWDKSGKEKKRLSYPRQTPRVRFPKYRHSGRRESTIRDTATLSVSPLNPKLSASSPALASPSGSGLHQGTRHAVRVLQDGTSHVLVAIDGARKKIIHSGLGNASESRLDRKRTELKSQIRLVGPVNPYSYGNDPWI
ncbi:hypothetical protein BDW74DRAFT_160149 [Aspergillus multicolor]|uniref:uncharacterized protein n=1 Tax=Aspergillus multicolor TaxID=41759 RepID=UPI003CCE1AF2